MEQESEEGHPTSSQRERDGRPSRAVPSATVFHPSSADL